MIDLLTEFIGLDLSLYLPEEIYYTFVGIFAVVLLDMFFHLVSQIIKKVFSW